MGRNTRNPSYRMEIEAVQSKEQAMTLKIEINADNVAFEGSSNLEMAAHSFATLPKA